MPQESRPALEALKRTNSKKTTEEKTLPKLLVSREKAEEKIQEQIQKGQQIIKQSVDTKAKSIQVLEDFGRWLQYNKSLLLKLFDTQSMADEYTKICGSAMLSNSYSYRLNSVQSSLHSMFYKIIIDNCNNYLKGICEQLELYDELLETPSNTIMENGTHVFIGHGRSQDWRELKDFISDKLQLPWDEFNRVPVAGVTNIARLAEMLDQACMAFLVLTAEDEQTDGTLHARENVIHEAGLFQGRLGFEKAIILLEEGCQEFSNIHGLGQIRFPKGNIKAAFEEIRQVLEREGII